MANDVDTASELSKIAKLNGDFRRNYGTLIGAILYLRERRPPKPLALGWPDFDRFFDGAELVGAARVVFASVALMASNNAPLFR